MHTLFLNAMLLFFNCARKKIIALLIKVEACNKEEKTLIDILYTAVTSLTNSLN